MRERHRHVEVGDASVEAGGEDRLVEARVARVQDRVRLHTRDQLDELLAAGRVDALGREAVRLAQPPDGRLRALERDVGEHHLREHLAALRDRGERRADTARSDDENLHRPQSDAKRKFWMSQMRAGRATQCSRPLPYAAPIRAAPNTSRP